MIVNKVLYPVLIINKQIIDPSSIFEIIKLNKPHRNSFSILIQIKTIVGLTKIEAESGLIPEATVAIYRTLLSGLMLLFREVENNCKKPS